MPNYAMSDPKYWEGVRQPIPGVRAKNFSLDAHEPKGPRVTVMEMEPGFVIARHAHNCERFEVIVKGTLHIGDRVFGPGDIMTAHADEYYGPKVCGPEGCTTVEVFSTPHEGESLLFELADGSKVPFEPEKGMPDNLADSDWIAQQRDAILAQTGSSIR